MMHLYCPLLKQKEGVDEAHLSLSDYPAALVCVARYRLEVIRPILEMEHRTRAAVLARVQEIKAAQPEHGDHTLRDSLSTPSFSTPISRARSKIFTNSASISFRKRLRKAAMVS